MAAQDTKDVVAMSVSEHLHAAAELLSTIGDAPAEDSRKVSAPFVHLKWMLVPLFCSLTGYTDKAVRRKIDEGVWLRGRHYRKAPDGRISMNLQEYYAWVESV